LENLYFYGGTYALSDTEPTCMEDIEYILKQHSSVTISNHQTGSVQYDSTCNTVIFLIIRNTYFSLKVKE